MKCFDVFDIIELTTLVGGTCAAFATYGLTSTAMTLMATGTVSVSAQAVEVAALQGRKSLSDGDVGWQVANDCMNSIFYNGGKIASPILTKASITSVQYFVTDIAKHKVVPLAFSDFLKSPGGKILPYVSAAIACGFAAYGFCCRDPIAVANQRGYVLR